jgi:hypothetical protein
MRIGGSSDGVCEGAVKALFFQSIPAVSLPALLGSGLLLLISP